MKILKKKKKLSLSMIDHDYTWQFLMLEHKRLVYILVGLCTLWRK